MRRNQRAAEEDEYVFVKAGLFNFTHLSQLSQRHILSDSGYIRIMDLLARESEKLALLQETILLLPNSLTVKEFPDRLTSLRATHHLELCPICGAQFAGERHSGSIWLEPFGGGG